MKRVLGVLVAGVILVGGVSLADRVQLPPAEEEIAAMEQAFSCLTGFFSEFIVEFKDAVAALDRADQNLEARYRALAIQLKDAEATILQLSDICERVPGIARRVEGLEDRLQEAWSRIAELRKEIEAQLSALGGRITGAEDAIDHLEARTDRLVGQLGDRLAKLAAELTDMRDQFTADLASFREQYSEELATIREQQTKLASQIGDHAVRITELEELDLGSLHRRVLALEQATQALQIKIENNRHKIEGVELAVAGFTADIRAQNKSIEELRGRVDGHEGRIASLETLTQDLDLHAMRDALAMAQTLAVVGMLLGAGALVLFLIAS